MPVRRVLKIERLFYAHHGGPPVTFKFGVRPGKRSSPWIWFEVDAVPEFEGDVALFECERIKGGWKVLREVSG